MAEPETPELARAAVDGGADIIELGFPFSDPLAEGPVIREAAERALAAGMRTAACLQCLAATRERIGKATPIIPMTLRIPPRGLRLSALRRRPPRSRRDELHPRRRAKRASPGDQESSSDRADLDRRADPPRRRTNGWMALRCVSHGDHRCAG